MSQSRYNLRSRAMDPAFGSLSAVIPSTPRTVPSVGNENKSPSVSGDEVSINSVLTSPPGSVVSEPTSAKSVRTTTRSYSDVVRARSPSAPSETEEVSFDLLKSGQNVESEISSTPPVSVYSESNKEITSPGLGEESSKALSGKSNASDETSTVVDGDDRPWIEVRRKTSRGKLTSAQAKAVDAAAKTLTPEEKLRIEKRAAAMKIPPLRIRSNSDSVRLGSKTKGKGIDPEEWGNIHLESEEIDIDAQRAALKSWNEARDWQAMGDVDDPLAGEFAARENMAGPSGSQPLSMAATKSGITLGDNPDLDRAVREAVREAEARIPSRSRYGPLDWTS
ncbi:hypothetical protein BU15DRAFT_59030 [Melanogaster broomeanus]|nr:hypothetical protein BU15DRAFT_59030 [Melanogaster broomeanus]